MAHKPDQVITPVMTKSYTIQLVDLDLWQLLDGLEIRAEAWEKTASYFRTGRAYKGEFFFIEECSDTEEADGIAGHYRSIIDKICKQMEAQP